MKKCALCSNELKFGNTPMLNAGKLNDGNEICLNCLKKATKHYGIKPIDIKRYSLFDIQNSLQDNNIVSSHKEKPKIIKTVFFIIAIAIISLVSIIKTTDNEGNIDDEQKEIILLTPPNYQIKEEVFVRFDGAKSYFILIDNINIEDSYLVDSIKAIIDDVVKEKGSKLDIEILDSQVALELLYAKIGTNSLKRPLTIKENEIITEHWIASYTGEMVYSTDDNTTPPTNTLSLFPNANSEHEELGKYTTQIQYIPRTKGMNQSVINPLYTKQKEFESKYIDKSTRSCKPLRIYVIQNLKDMKSFEHVQSKYSMNDNYVVCTMEYQAKNSFGVNVTEVVKANVSYDGEVVSCEVLK